MHGWSQLLAFRAGSLLQNFLSLLLREAAKSRQRRSVVRPISNWRHRLNPDWRAAEPRIMPQLSAPISGRVAFRAFCHFFHQVFPGWMSPAVGRLSAPLPLNDAPTFARTFDCCVPLGRAEKAAPAVNAAHTMTNTPIILSI